MMAYPATVPNERALGTWTAPVRPYVELHIRPISERSLFGCFQELSSYSHGFIGKMVADRSWPVAGVPLPPPMRLSELPARSTPSGQERSVAVDSLPATRWPHFQLDGAASHRLHPLQSRRKHLGIDQADASNASWGRLSSSACYSAVPQPSFDGGSKRYGLCLAHFRSPPRLRE